MKEKNCGSMEKRNTEKHHHMPHLWRGLRSTLPKYLWARMRQQALKRKERVHLSKRAASIPPKTAVQRRAPLEEACLRAEALFQ